MEIEIIDPTTRGDWNRQIASIAGATIFHTANWARVLVESYGYRPFYFCAFCHGRLHGVIPFMEIDSPITGRRGVSLPFSDQVEPLVEDYGSFPEMLRIICRFARRRRWRTIEFRGGSGFFSRQDAFSSFVVHRIDLPSSFEALSKGFRSATRRNIKKAVNLGVRAAVCTSRASMAEFYRLNCLTRQAHGLPPQPRRFFDSIRQNILAAGKGFICLGYYGKRVVSGVVFFLSNGHAVYKYGASDKRFLHLRPNDLVMARAIQWATQYGAATLDLGRTEPAHQGLMQFKSGWGADASPLDYFKIDAASGRLLTGRPGLRSSYPFFRKLPVPVLQMIGNLAYRHVG